MVSPNPLTAPFLVAKSDMLAILPRRLAVLFTTICQLRSVELALDIPQCEIELLFHARHKADPAFIWFSQCIKGLAADIAENVAPASKS